VFVIKAWPMVNFSDPVLASTTMIPAIPVIERRGDRLATRLYLLEHVNIGRGSPVLAPSMP
jgi:hypothetical protein